jgi:hypothetical protein
MKLKENIRLRRVQENVELDIHAPIRLHGVVLIELSTGRTLPVLYSVKCNALKTTAPPEELQYFN